MPSIIFHFGIYLGVDFISEKVCIIFHPQAARSRINNMCHVSI